MALNSTNGSQRATCTTRQSSFRNIGGRTIYKKTLRRVRDVRRWVFFLLSLPLDFVSFSLLYAFRFLWSFLLCLDPFVLLSSLFSFFSLWIHFVPIFGLYLLFTHEEAPDHIIAGSWWIIVHNSSFLPFHLLASRFFRRLSLLLHLTLGWPGKDLVWLVPAVDAVDHVIGQLLSW